MMEIIVPGRGTYTLQHAVFDVNGTLAVDGKLIKGVPELIAALRRKLEVHLLTADTHGRQSEIDAILGFPAHRIGKAVGKAEYVRQLGAGGVVAFGNGANDTAMLEAASLGIAVMGREGLAVRTLMVADIVVADIRDGILLLLRPDRMIATLRI